MSGRGLVAADPSVLTSRYREVRGLSEPLDADDYRLQSMPECSPPKWHLAHTTWFFETPPASSTARTSHLQGGGCTTTRPPRR